MDEMGQSAIKEVGNICSGASLASISEFTGMKYLYSIPLFASDMFGAILNAILSKFAVSASSTLVVMAELKVEEVIVNSTMLFIFTSEDVELILEKLKVV
jgi:chemotaxis protein CheC